MAVTIKDIAKQAGVSHSTVLRALHGSNLISDETTKRIRQVALDLGYFPSAAARSLKTNRSHALGVIVSAVDDPFFSEILQGIEAIAQEHGYSLLMAASQRNPEREQAIVQDMCERHVDGFIICSAYINPPLTTLDQPKHYIGAEAVRLILGLLDPLDNEELDLKIKSY